MLSLPGIGAVGLPVAVQHVGVVGDVHGVGAIGQVGEAVVAAGVGGGGGDDIAVAVMQHHGHAGEATRLAALQRAIGVGVLPDRAGDGVGAAGVTVAEVLEQVDSDQQPARLTVEVLLVAAIRIDRVGQPGGQGGGLHLDHVGGCGRVRRRSTARFHWWW